MTIPRTKPFKAGFARNPTAFGRDSSQARNDKIQGATLKQSVIPSLRGISPKAQKHTRNNVYLHRKGFKSAWNGVRFKYLADVRKGRLPYTAESSSGDALPYLSMEYLRGQTDEPSFAAAREDSVVAEDGDSLLLWDGANAGEFLRARRGVVSSTAALVSPREVDGEFLYWTCKGHERYVRAETVVMGIPHVNGEFLDNLVLRVPPISTQKAIAHYLCRETARIDDLIAEKEKMLKLLEEKRTALISRAVTKGIDPNVRMRPSGVELVRSIPEHWKIIRLKHLAEIYYGLSQPPEYRNDGIAFVRATNVKRGRIVAEGLVFVEEADLPSSRVIRLHEGDIIVVRSGAYTGDSGLVTKEWRRSVAGYDMVLRFGASVEPEFVQYALLSPYVLNYQIDPLCIRAAQPHLNAEELGDVAILLPSRQEQQAIVDFVRPILAEMDDLIVVLRDSLRLLGERRTTLVSAAVTGRIDIPATPDYPEFGGRAALPLAAEGRAEYGSAMVKNKH